MKEVNFQYYSSVQETEVEWLWYPYIPYGKLTLLQGDPGEGKSTFILNIVALLTTGKPMPDGYKAGGIQTVIYQCCEDGAADTVKPRLMAAGADCKKVAYIIDGEDALTLDDGRIEEAVIKTGARLLIMDPLQSFVPQDGDLHNAGKMRSLLGRLAAVAEKHRCAIVLVGHMNKSQDGKSLLMGKDMPGNQIIHYMAQIGISKRTVDKAKKKLGITSYKVKRKWYWSPPQDGCAPDGGEAGDGRQD